MQDGWGLADNYYLFIFLFQKNNLFFTIIQKIKFSKIINQLIFYNK